MNKLVLVALFSLLLAGCVSQQASAPAADATAAPTVEAPVMEAKQTPAATQAAAAAQATASEATTAAPAQSPTATQAPSAKVVEVTGTTNGGAKWEWRPATINLKKGEKVKIRVTVPSGDTEHGFAVPELGISVPAPQGRTVETPEFTPEKAGTFSFFCNVFCGAGHPGMRGQIVVTE